VIDPKAKPDFNAAIGQPSSGKTTWIVDQVTAAAPPRVITLHPDPDEGRHPGRVIRSTAELYRLTLEPSFTAVFEPSFIDDQAVRDFDDFCVIALEAAERHGSITAVIEELQDFDRPNRSPVGWQKLYRRGRKRGVSLWAAAQRPVGIIGFYSGCSRIWIGAQNADVDHKRLGATTGIPPEAIATLQLGQFIVRDKNKGTITPGQFPWYSAGRPTVKSSPGARRRR
jgi:hypothetical protein